MKLVVNRGRDFMERVGWTAIEAGLGALTDYIASGEVTWRGAVYAVGFAVIKVVGAQRIGKTNDGAAIPGGVVAPETIAVAPPESG